MSSVSEHPTDESKGARARVYTRKPKRSQEVGLKDFERIVDATPSVPRVKKTAASKSEQMVLDLGQKIQYTCKDCGMTFDKSDRQDKATHEKYHSRLIKGVEWTGKTLLAQGKLLKESTVSIEGDEEVIRILSYDNWHRLDFAVRNKVECVHEDVNHALGASVSSSDLLKSGKTIVAICKGRVIASAIVGPAAKGRCKRIKMHGNTDMIGALFVP